MYSGKGFKGAQIMGAPNLQLISHPSERLFEVAKPVEFNDDNDSFMHDFCYYYTYLRKRLGRAMVGLAAPQVGRNLRMFIVLDVLYINPEIIWTSTEADRTEKEGCLSLPAGMSWDVKRPYGCRIKWQDMGGTWYERRYNDLTARAIQHEMDHLNGKLICGADFKNDK